MPDLNMNLIDIHSHILPGIDDGAEDMNITVEMLHMAYANGTRQIVLTPHHKPERRCVKPEGIRKRTQMLQKYLKSEQIPIKLYAGQEHYYHQELPDKLDAGEALTLGDTRYTLVEFNPLETYEYIRQAVFELQTHGYKPVLAHVERIKALSTGIEKIEALKSMGALVQVNAESVVGKNGLATKWYVKKLIKKNIIDFIASDAHDTTTRVPDLKTVYQYLEKKYGTRYAQTVLRENQQKLLQDLPL